MDMKPKTHGLIYKEVNALLNYNPLLGLLSRKVTQGGQVAGDVVGSMFRA